MKPWPQKSHIQLLVFLQCYSWKSVPIGRQWRLFLTSFNRLLNLTDYQIVWVVDCTILFLESFLIVGKYVYMYCSVTSFVLHISARHRITPCVRRSLQNWFLLLGLTY